MDMATLALAKAYTDSRQIAGDYVKTYDPDIDGSENFPFRADELLGLKVREKRKPFYYLTAPKERPPFNDKIYFGRISDNPELTWRYTDLSYRDFDGVLSKPVLSIYLIETENSYGAFVKNYCPLLGAKYPGYTNIIYCYEDTSDTLGLGLTIPKGWYLINADTFAFTPFNIELYPVYITPEQFAWSEQNLLDEYGWVNDPYFYECFELRDEFSYTLTEENIYGSSDSSMRLCSFMGIADTLNLIEGMGLSQDQSAWLISFTLMPNMNGLTRNDVVTGLKISWTETKQIDPKYIPAMDSLTLVSPDGTSYKVTVDDSGNLTATAT